MRFMYTIKSLPEFSDWLASLKDPLTRARLVRRLEKVGRGLLGDVEPVGEGVGELREHFGPGWRMYYIERNGALIVMLAAATKPPSGPTLPGRARWQGRLRSKQ